MYLRPAHFLRQKCAYVNIKDHLIPVHKYKCTDVPLCTSVRYVHNDKYGQPTPSTHPHLLKKGEVNVGITRTEFQHRRQKLVEKILGNNKLSGRGLIILPSARKKYMIDQIPYFFRQDTDFRYLTGCLQPNSILAIEFTESSSSSYLLLRENTAYEEKWDGPRFGFREATEFFGVDETFSVNTFQEYLYRFGKENLKMDLWYDFVEPRDQETHKTVLDFISSLSNNNLSNIDPLREVIHEVRSVKSQPEINLMRKTCKIGAQALKKTISSSKHLSTELDYLATVDYHSRLAGAYHLAYPPVVATGDNANTIHYIAATQATRDGDLMLMDSGSEYHGYSSDITRTWPVSGDFSKGQSVIYDIVLECQEKLINSIIPGETSIDKLYRSMQTQLAKSLQSAGIIDEQDPSTAMRFVHLYCPHNVGHHLGMDVHDCASVSKQVPLVAGNIITVEPGIYIRKDNTRVSEEFRGQGIRIEDDLLITETGCEILTKDCPKTKSELQDIIKNAT